MVGHAVIERKKGSKSIFGFEFGEGKEGHTYASSFYPCKYLTYVGVMKLKRQKKCILVAEKAVAIFDKKPLRLFLFFETTFLFLDQIFLFLDLDCQNLATLDFDNRPISENENSLAEKKLCLRAILSQCNTFPATRNIYSTLQVTYALRLHKQSHAYTYMYNENAYDMFIGSYYKIHVIL